MWSYGMRETEFRAFLLAYPELLVDLLMDAYPEVLDDLVPRYMSEEAEFFIDDRGGLDG